MTDWLDQAGRAYRQATAAREREAEDQRERRRQQDERARAVGAAAQERARRLGADGRALLRERAVLPDFNFDVKLYWAAVPGRFSHRPAVTRGDVRVSLGRGWLIVPLSVDDSFSGHYEDVGTKYEGLALDEAGLWRRVRWGGAAAQVPAEQRHAPRAPGGLDDYYPELSWEWAEQGVRGYVTGAGEPRVEGAFPGDGPDCQLLSFRLYAALHRLGAV